MKLDKLVKQIRRDLLANPKKAAALGLMLLVAAYFWAPLMWRWLAPEGKKSAQTNKHQLILTDDPAEPKAQQKTGSFATFRWERVLQLMEADPRMVTATLDSSVRNPFAALPPPPETEQTDLSAAAAEKQRALALAPVEVSPEQAGLKLASVAIGQRGRSAIIGGETYREGQTIAAEGKDKTNPSAQLEFVIVRIERRGVELERNGKTWMLRFDQPKLAQGDGIERAEGSKRD